ncbi:hypothetical protein SADUNF_Sadunf02G0099400 [Salix dunnii]|uniref:Uncharacterized protein n=1 Tax=Salix dunnii TaxID=1413687 RepID=A0A835THC2_9ROSI|nr:hypothetical protein SADUNF_Sadunf02G0099400 [Salix dunnii]
MRFWDIRGAGCFLVLKQFQSQLGRRPAIPSRSAMNKGFTVKGTVKRPKSLSKTRLPQKRYVSGNAIKHAPLGQIPAKRPLKQRLHRRISSQDRATAHYGAVTGLEITGDGMYLLSAS